MFYNEKGQHCLRLFDFEAMSICPNEASDRWQVRKIIGDECHVFMLQSSIEVLNFWEYILKSIKTIQNHLNVKRIMIRE